MTKTEYRVPAPSRVSGDMFDFISDLRRWLNGKGYVRDSDLGALAFLDSVNLQDAYTAQDAAPQVSLVSDGLTIRDNATPIGASLFAVQSNAGTTSFSVEVDQIDIGPSGRRMMSMQFPDATGRFGTELWPDDFAVTTATGTAFAAFFSDDARVITLNIPGGGGLGNDTAPGGINLPHTVRFEDTGFLFSAQLLINAAVKVECATNTVGPLYLFLDQYVTYADGGSRTCSQHNTIRAQPKWGPNINGGSITQTSAQLYFAATTVDATVGSASVTTLDYFLAVAPQLIAGGTVGTFTVLNIPDIPAAGITTIRGINSAMGSGTFILHSGAAVSTFAGNIHMNNGISLVLGTVGGNRVELLRPAAGVLRMVGVGGTFNEALDLDFDVASNVVELTSSTAAALRVSNLLDINNGVALGAGAAATLGLIGGSGPTAAAQAQWVRIDVGGVAHWIPAWT